MYFNDKINLKFMNNKSTDVVIISAVRTPIGTYKGSLKDLRVDQLGTIVISEVLKRGKISSNQIDEVIMGQVLTDGGGQNPARQAAVNAGIPISKPAYLVNQVCVSGLRAVISGYQSIKLRDADYIICGGQENMSMTPHTYFYSEEKEILKDQLINTMIHDGLIDAFNNYHMGVTAENVAKKFNISRQQQDEFALLSQKKTEIAIKNNKFDNEIINIDYNETFLDRDEHPRKDLKLSDLEKLRTVFKNDGTVTPGNSSGINDGAAALLLTTLKEAEKKINIRGPFPADTIFLKQNRKKYDVILGMYHDQVLAPIKILKEYNAINITLGLPFIRVSPDHGPNKNMINKNLSNPLSLIKSIKFLDKSDKS